MEVQKLPKHCKAVVIGGGGLLRQLIYHTQKLLFQMMYDVPSHSNERT